MRGCSDVILIEKEREFGQGSTRGCAGGIRYQFASDINIRMSLLSLPMLEIFEEEHRQAIDLRQCGYLFLLTCPNDAKVFQNNVIKQRSLGVMTDWLDLDEVRRRLPDMKLNDVLAGTFHPKEGLADTNGVLMGYINSAKRLGVRTLTDAEVTNVTLQSGQVDTIHTTKGPISCKTVVNACGPWASQVGRMVGLSLPISPLQRQWMTTTPIPEVAPDFPFVVDFARSLYFHREGDGLLTGMSNPDEQPSFDQNIDHVWELTHTHEAAARFPLLEHAGIVARVAGLYEVTPDAHPIIGKTSVEGFYVAAGFSGHGFMHSPVTGILIAEEILDGQATTLDISTLDLTRFSVGKTPREYHVI